MTDQLDNGFVVRVLDTAGRTAGVGVLVDRQEILTCAHVVNVALGRDRTAQDRPTGEVTVAFAVGDGPPVRARVHRYLLWAAFLADLRADFDRGRRADERSLNCVVLLDNVDTVLGHRFLEDLVRARRQRVAGGQDDADPLTVVATSRGALLADVPTADRTLVTSDNPCSGQLPRATDRSRRWWLQYRLPDLTEDDVGRAVAALTLNQGNDQRLTRVVFQRGADSGARC